MDGEADEIEITPEMVSAGVREYAVRFLALAEPGDPNAMTEAFSAIFAAMLKASPLFRGKES